MRALHHMIENIPKKHRASQNIWNFPYHIKVHIFTLYICSHSHLLDSSIFFFILSIYSFCLFSFFLLLIFPPASFVSIIKIYSKKQKRNFHISYCAISICMMLLLFTEWEIWLLSRAMMRDHLIHLNMNLWMNLLLLSRIIAFIELVLRKFVESMKIDWELMQLHDKLDVSASS